MWNEWMNALSAFPIVPELLLKITLLLGFAWIFKPLVDRVNPQWQVLYWRGAATAAVLLPIVVLLGPTVTIPLFQADPIEPVASSSQGTGTADAWRESLHWSDGDTVVVEQEYVAPESVTVPTVSHPTPAGQTASAINGVSGWDWNTILIVGWLMPVLFLVIGALFIEWRTTRLVRQARTVPKAAAELLAQVSRDLGFTGRVRACLSPHVESPRVTGILRATILLPETAQTPDPTDLRGIFAHEVCHLKGHDLKWLRLIQVLSISLWFHPLVWRLGRQHLDACERNCDAAAAAYVGDASVYAGTLARIALDVIGRRRILAGIALARKPRICDRLLHLQNVVPVTPLRLRHVLPVIAVGLILLMVGGGLQLVEAESPASTDASAEGPETASEISEKGDATINSDSPTAGAKFDCKLIDLVSRVPIAGGTVTLQLRISGGGKTFKEWPLVRRTEYTTNADGKFTLEILPEEQGRKNLYVEIEADHPDYVHSYGGYSYTMIKKNLKMGAEPWFKSLGIFPAAKLTGTVVTPDGEPAAGVFAFGATRLHLDSHQTSGHYFKGETDEQGRFEFKMIRGGEAVVNLSPEKYSPSTHLAKQRLSGISRMALEFFGLDRFAPDALTDTAKTRDLGRIVLEEGVRIQGRVVDVDGNPVEGIWVNAYLTAGPAKKNVGRGWANPITRSALTNAEGRFEMCPLQPSTYRVTPSEEPRERSLDREARHPLPAVFYAQETTLAQGTKTATVDFQAVPHVAVVAQYYTSSGEPRSGSDISLFGKHGDGFFAIRKEPDANGRVEFMAPVGLENAELDLITNEHSSLRHRITKDGPLLNGDRVKLRTITEAMTDIGIIRYVAPILLIQAVDEAGEPIEDFEAKLLYGPDRSPLPGGGEYLRDGRSAGHVSMHEQSDGRWRTSQLLPDEDLTLTVEAHGYESKSQTINVPEGETREIEVTLKKTPTSNPSSG